MMELVNEWEKTSQLVNLDVAVLTSSDIDTLLQMLAPFVPFLAEDLWHLRHGTDAASVHLQAWPQYDESLARTETIVLPIQVNGRVRAQVTIGAEEASIKMLF